MIRFLAFTFLLVEPAVGALVLTADDPSEIVRNAARLIEERYVDAGQAKQIRGKLREAGRRWDGMTDPQLFADTITKWLRKTSGDGHLGISYSEKALPEDTGEASFSADEMEKYYGAHLNHGIEKIERLPGNIIRIDLRVPPEAGWLGMYSQQP